jgi:hypothetical protein
LSRQDPISQCWMDWKEFWEAYLCWKPGMNPRLGYNGVCTASPTIFFLCTCPSESIPLPSPMSSLVVRPQGWALLGTTWPATCVGMLREPKSSGKWEIRHTDTQT